MHKPSVSRDRPHEKQTHVFQKKQLSSKTVRVPSRTLPVDGSFCQCLRSSVMSCCSRCQCVCGVITSFVQRGCDLPVNVDFCRMSFDPNKAKTPWCCVSAESQIPPTGQHCPRCPRCLSDRYDDVCCTCYARQFAVLGQLFLFLMGEEP